MKILEILAHKRAYRPGVLHGYSSTAIRLLGNLLLISPVSKNETQLPSPEALRKKIILKHKKLQVEWMSENFDEDIQEIDIFERLCNKKGILYLRDNTNHVWTKHLFVLFQDRLCYALKPINDDDTEEQNSATFQGFFYL